MLLFWKNVRSELEYKGITQKELAAAIEESYNTVQSWINKERLPNVEQAVKIAKFLHITVEYLVTGNKEIIHPSTADETLLHNFHNLSETNKNNLIKISEILK